MGSLTAESSAIDDDRVAQNSGPHTSYNRGASTTGAKVGKVLSLDRFRSGKAYTIGQAARLADTSPATVRRWLKGYNAPGHHMEPVFGAKPEDDNRLSFLELVELIVASGFRKNIGTRSGVPLDRVRRAHTYARERWGLPYPFASLRLLHDGVHVLREFDDEEAAAPRLLALDAGGQWALPGAVIEQFENHLEFSRRRNDPFAIRWRPYGTAVPIVVDPHVAGGQPTVAGRAITIETLRSRRDAGESLQSIAEDYELPVQVLEDVLERAA